MCLILDENAVVPDGSRGHMLSSYICTEENWGNVDSLNKSDKCTASWLAYASTIYSDSHDESATTGCFFELHVTGPHAKTHTSNLKRSENCWDRRCGWHP